MTGPVVSWATAGCALWVAAVLESHPVALFVVLWCAVWTGALIAYFWATRPGYYERRESRYEPRHAPAPAAAHPRQWWAWVRSRHPLRSARETAGGESRASDMAPVPAVVLPQGWPGTTPPLAADTVVDGIAAISPLGQPGSQVENVGERAGLIGRGLVPLPHVAAPGTRSPGWTNRQPWDTVTLEPVPAGAP